MYFLQKLDMQEGQNVGSNLIGWLRGYLATDSYWLEHLFSKQQKTVDSWRLKTGERSDTTGWNEMKD